MSFSNLRLLIGLLLAIAIACPQLWAARTKKHGQVNKATVTKPTNKANIGKSNSHKSQVNHPLSKRGKAKTRKKRSARARGQQSIQSDRVREIQEALIREHYLDGDASGVWDSSTKTAMQRFQEDNGWQTKVMPDSRALIKLGLGPSRDGLLNPDSAALSPHEFAGEKEIPGGSVQAK